MLIKVGTHLVKNRERFLIVTNSVRFFEIFQDEVERFLIRSLSQPFFRFRQLSAFRPCLFTQIHLM